VRPDTLGYLQRSYLGCVSETDAHEAREVGEKAVQFSVWHDVDGSVAIKRVGDYAVEYELLKLTDVAGKTKLMCDEFINAEGNGVSDAFKAYARPLVGDLATVDRIAAPMVQKLGRIG
jgi:6-phosphofructokinase 1